MQNRKPRTIGGTVRVSAGPDDKGNGWFVDIEILSIFKSTWLTVPETRKLIRELKVLVKKPRSPRNHLHMKKGLKT